MRRSTSDRAPGAVHLVRHLATDGVPASRIDRRALGEWFAAQDGRGIAPDTSPSDELVALVAAGRYLVVSPLARAQATAAMVLERLPTGCHPRMITDDELHEAPLPVLRVPRIRLSVSTWGFACRAAWMSGYAGGVEPRAAATRRADDVAQRLTDFARSGDVTAVGHGYLNILVARGLRRRGWAGPRIPGAGHGATTTYRRSGT